MNSIELKRIVEALVLCSDAPMGLAQIKAALAIEVSHDELRTALEDIAQDWSQRAVRLIQVSTGWRFQSAPDLMPYVDRMRAEKPAVYSRAVLETLAIIAYRQPVTRGDIEDIRGVTVSSHIIKTLEERGWIDAVGHREVVGRPTLFATTKQFLDDLGLKHVYDLPSLADAQPESPDLLNGITRDAVTDLPVQIQVVMDEETEILDDSYIDEHEQMSLSLLDGVDVMPQTGSLPEPNKD